MNKHLRTSDLARAVGVHPNTVRLYEAWGLLPPVRRSPAGYRLFTREHLDCLRLARLLYAGEYSGRALRRSGTQIIRSAVGGDWGGALEAAYEHLALVQAERARADAAVALLERWVAGIPADAIPHPLKIGAAATLLGVSVDVLRNWERNGLIRTQRDPTSGYRLYGQGEISRLRVIRMLTHAGYSLMAILRMLTRLDQGLDTDVRRSLDTPRPDEDAYTAADRWLTTLEHEDARAHAVIELIERTLRTRAEQVDQP